MAAFPFVNFRKWANSFLSGRKIPNHLPSWSIFLGSPRYQTLIHELLVPKPSNPFCIIGWLMGHICPHSSCFWACLLELSQSQLGLAAHLEDSRLLGLPRYPGSIFSLGSSAIFLPLKAGLDFFFPLFREVQSLPIPGLRSLPMGF